MKRNIGFFLLSAISLISACGMLDETTEANKIVAEANVEIVKNNAQVMQSNALFTQLFNTGLASVDGDNLEDYKKENKAKFDEFIKLSGDMDKTSNDLISKFDQASKLKLNEKYKEYLVLKSQEYKKRQELDKLVVPFINSFLEAKDVDKINGQIGEYNEKSTAIKKEIDDLGNKADKVVKDNPNLIK